MGIFGKAPEIKVKVEGMTCSHCQMRVKKAIEGVKGVKKAEVDLRGKIATATLENEGAATCDEIISAIVKAGYQASQVK